MAVPLNDRLFREAQVHFGIMNHNLPPWLSDSPDYLREALKKLRPQEQNGDFARAIKTALEQTA